MTTTIKSSPDGTQGIIQVNGVDKLTLNTDGVLLASAIPATGLRSTALATMQKFADEFGSSLASSGYQKLPSGLIIQWGLASLAYSGLQEYTGTVTMPITFPSAMRSIVGTSNDAMNTAKIVMTLTGTSSSAWKARFEENMSGGGNSFTWIAIGY